MNFGKALELLKQGRRLQRAGWNGKNMWLVFVPATPDATLREGTPYHAAMLSAGDARGRVTIDAHIDMYTVKGTMQPGWLASMADILSDDWQVVT